MFPTIVRALSGALVLSSFGNVALAQDAGDTMSKIRQTRTITLGVRESARPFSFADAQKRPAGYSVDLCLNAVEEIKRELKLPELKVQFSYVTGAERIPKLLSGEIDMECGSTTNTKARQEKVDFSYTIFVAGMRVLAPRTAKIDTLRDLDGMTIGLSKGTTSEKLFSQLASGELNAKLQTFASNLDAYRALREGKVRAFPQDDSLLIGLAANDKGLDELGLSSLTLSVEPYAVMTRKGDAALLAAIDRSLARLYASGEITNLYNKWFASEKLTIRMSRLTRDSFTRPNKEAGVAMLLGYSI